MKHGLVIMKPPYATGIITQHDGSIMLKFELLRKQDVVDMLMKAIDDVEKHPDTDKEDKFQVVNLNKDSSETTKVVPDTGNPRMAMTQVKVATLQHRDDLPMDFRKIGRRIYVEENKVEYELKGGLTNQFWKEANPDA